MESNLQHFMLQNLRDPIIIEAGVCNGKETREFCEMFPNGKIYGFEPVPSLFNQATERVKGFNNVELYQKALSDQTSVNSMFVSRQDGQISESSSLLAPKVHLTYHPQIKFEENIEVECINLDEFVEEKGLTRIDLMWLDLQGYEPPVLKASLNALKMTKFLYTEVNILEVYENVIKWPEFYNFLSEHGFQKIYDDLYYPRDAGNALLVNTNLID